MIPVSDWLETVEKANPRPWRLSDNGWDIRDSNGETVCRVAHGNEATANFILEAANEYDGRHTFCTQDCVWMGQEIKRLESENAVLRCAKEEAEKRADESVAAIRKDCDNLRDIVRRLVCLVSWREQNDAGVALLREALEALGDEP